MFSLHKLELFAYVAQLGSISKAAEHLLMSQPNVSQHMQDLEAEFGEQLLIRTPRGIALTPAGETLFQYAQQIFKLVAEARLVLTNISRLDNGNLSLTATPGAGLYLLPGWIERFRALYPQFTVSIKTGITTEVIELLMNNQCEIGFVEGELEEIYLPERFKVLILDNVQQYVVVGQTHVWWQRPSLSLRDLHEQPALLRQMGSRSRTWLDRILKSNGVRLRCVGEFDNPEAIKQALMAGNAFAVMPPYIVRREVEQGLLHLIPVTDCPLHRQLKLIWNKEWPFSPLLAIFLRHLAEQFAIIHSILNLPSPAAPRQT
jgi:DNA-binding transcriptional LysR family regulator